METDKRAIVDRRDYADRLVSKEHQFCQHQNLNQTRTSNEALLSLIITLISIVTHGIIKVTITIIP